MSASDERQRARAPLASLIRKSERALRKLAPGSGSHTRLRNDVEALRLAWKLIDDALPGANAFDLAELDEALKTLGALIGRVEGVQAKFLPGTSAHTLQRNRLHALRVAEAVTNAERGRRACG